MLCQKIVFVGVMKNQIIGGKLPFKKDVLKMFYILISER